MENTENKPNFALNTPTAIIVAGLIVAGAIILTRPSTGMMSNRVMNNEMNEMMGAVAGAKISLDKPIHELLGLNDAKFKKCLTSEEIAAQVEAQYQDGVLAGVQGTPASVLIAGGNTYFLSGAQPVEAIRAAIDSILNDKAGAGENIAVAPISAADHILGNPEAEIKIIEFSDLECPFCKQFHPTLRQIVEEYKGKVAWVYRHFPIDSLHSKADAEAAAAECAAQQGGNEMFWRYIDKLFEITPSNNGFDLEFL